MKYYIYSSTAYTQYVFGTWTYALYSNLELPQFTGKRYKFKNSSFASRFQTPNLASCDVVTSCTAAICDSCRDSTLSIDVEGMAAMRTSLITSLNKIEDLSDRSSPPSDQPTFLNRISPTALDGDPFTGKVLAGVALFCSCFAFFVFFNRFCLKRRILQLVEGNSIGRFMVELRAEAAEGIDGALAADCEPLRQAESDSERGLEVLLPFLARYMRTVEASVNSSRGTAELVETTATTVGGDFEMVMTCDCDLSEGEDDTDRPTRSGGVVRVLDGNIFSPLTYRAEEHHPR